MGIIEARLKELGITLPAPRNAPTKFVPAVQVGDLLFLSGNLPTVKDSMGTDKMVYPGTLGLDLSVEDGYKAARQIAINHLSWIKEAVGDLDRIQRIVKMTGYIKAVPGFDKAPWVLNGASELFHELFGPERGSHARAAVAVNGLAFNAAVEADLIVQLRQPGCEDL